MALTRHALLQAGARVPLGVSCVCQPETEALRGLRTPTVSVLIRLPGEMRRGGWSHCQGGQARYPLCHARFSHPTLEGHGSCRAPSLWDPPRTHVSLLVSDTDTDPPFLQCGGCRHRIRHCYRQTKGQVELHKSILDTNSCKYLFLCFLK